MGRGCLKQELAVEEKNERKTTPVKMELLKLRSWVSKKQFDFHPDNTNCWDIDSLKGRETPYTAI